MARFIVFLLLLVPIAHAGLWLAERPGTFAFNWLGWHVEVSMALLAITLAVALFLSLMIGMTIWAMIKLPKQRALQKELSRTKTGLAQLNTALISTRSQDYGSAQRALMKAGKMLPDSPLPHLVGLQLSVRQGEDKDTRTHLSALRAHDDTAPLALQQLVRDAFAREAYDEAEQLLAETYENFPRAEWQHIERVRLAVRTKKTDALLEELSRVSFKHRLAAQQRKTLRAELYHLQGEHEKALRILPAFAPAALAVAADSNIDDSTALSHIFTAWKAQPSRPLLASFIHRTQELADKPLLKQARRFANAANGKAEADDVMAASLEKLGQLDDAVAHAKRAIETCETPERFERLASILAKRDGAEAANPWLKQALEAQTEEVWACAHCGSHYANWQMECSACDALEQVEWTSRARSTNTDIRVVDAA